MRRAFFLAAMDLRPAFPVRSLGPPAAPLPTIHNQSSKVVRSKAHHGKNKPRSAERLQPVMKSVNQNSPSKASIDNNSSSIVTMHSSAVIGDDGTQKAELLREGYFKAKTRADEFLVLVAEEKENLNARSWIAGEDLYGFRTRSNEKKQQYQQANRLYYGLSTLLYASIGAMKANELDIYVRRKSVLLPESMFNIREWEPFLHLAKECRSMEWIDACNMAARMSEQATKELAIKNEIEKCLNVCLEKIRVLHETSTAMKREVQDYARAFKKYISVTTNKLSQAVASLNNKLDDTKYALDVAQTASEEERKKTKLLRIELDDKKGVELHLLRSEYEDKMRSLRKGHEAELNEKDHQRIFLTRENEELSAIHQQKVEQYNALDSKLFHTEFAYAAMEDRIREYELKEEMRMKSIQQDLDIQIAAALKASTEEGELAMQKNEIDANISKDMEEDDDHHTVESEPSEYSENFDTACQNCVSLKDRILILENELIEARELQVRSFVRTISLTLFCTYYFVLR